MKKLLTSSWFYPVAEAIIFFIITIGIFQFASTPGLPLTFGCLSLIFVVHRLLSVIEFERVFSQRFDALDESFKKDTERLNVLGSIVNLSQLDMPEKIRELASATLSVTEKGLDDYKDVIVEDAISNMKKLVQSKRTPVLQQIDFYKWLIREFKVAPAGIKFEIVSMDEELEWTDTIEEKEFLDANLEAAKRGVLITRIFVFSKGRFVAARENKGIYAHRDSGKSGLIGYVVDRQEVEKKALDAVRVAGQGFIIVDRKRVIVDKFEDMEARGYVTFEPKEVARYISTYETFAILKRRLSFTQQALPAPRI